MTALARLVDRLSDALAALAGWLLFVVGGMLVFEVVSRYVFNAPTVWAEELSRFLQVWAVYLAAASVLRHRQMIRIGMLVDRLPPRAAGVADILSLLFIAAFAGIAVVYGWDITRDSIDTGRTSASMLDVPQWWTEIAIPAGMGLLALQCLLEAARAARRIAAGERPPGGQAEH